MGLRRHCSEHANRGPQQAVYLSSDASHGKLTTPKAGPRIMMHGSQLVLTMIVCANIVGTRSRAQERPGSKFFESSIAVIVPVFSTMEMPVSLFK